MEPLQNNNNHQHLHLFPHNQEALSSPPSTQPHQNITWQHITDGDGQDRNGGTHTYNNNINIIHKNVFTPPLPPRFSVSSSTSQCSELKNHSNNNNDTTFSATPASLSSSSSSLISSPSFGLHGRITNTHKHAGGYQAQEFAFGQARDDSNAFAAPGSVTSSSRLVEGAVGAKGAARAADQAQDVEGKRNNKEPGRVLTQVHKRTLALLSPPGTTGTPGSGHEGLENGRDGSASAPSGISPFITTSSESAENGTKLVSNGEACLAAGSGHGAPGTSQATAHSRNNLAIHDHPGETALCGSGTSFLAQDEHHRQKHHGNTNVRVDLERPPTPAPNSFADRDDAAAAPRKDWDEAVCWKIAESLAGAKGWCTKGASGKTGDESSNNRAIGKSEDRHGCAGLDIIPGPAGRGQNTMPVVHVRVLPIEQPSRRFVRAAEVFPSPAKNAAVFGVARASPTVTSFSALGKGFDGFPPPPLAKIDTQDGKKSQARPDARGQEDQQHHQRQNQGPPDGQREDRQQHDERKSARSEAQPECWRRAYHGLITEAARKLNVLDEMERLVRRSWIERRCIYVSVLSLSVSLDAPICVF